jgi:exodeoxyribonuclease VII large subunit
MSEVFKVSVLNAYLRRLIERDAPLQDIWVEGEVSNLRAQSSGHLVFHAQRRAL